MQWAFTVRGSMLNSFTSHILERARGRGRGCQYACPSLVADRGAEGKTFGKRSGSARCRRFVTLSRRALA